MDQADRNSKRRRRRWGPVIVGLLFLLAAVGVSVDHFATTFREMSRQQDSQSSTRLPAAPSMDRAATELPFSESWPEGTVARQPAQIDSSQGLGFEETIEMAAPPEQRVAQISIEPPVQDLKISLDRSNWKGGPQLLPNPLSISQIEKSRERDIRGGGWVVIDIANSKIEPVELFENPRRGVIEAKYLDGRSVVNPADTGFPVVRGIPGVDPGGFEVFENPRCAVRYSGVSETEICEVRWKNTKLNFKFEAPVLLPDQPTPDFIFTTVFIDVGPGDLSRVRWQPVVSFNDSFHPIGDVNRDGYPDFYVESVTALDESGVQHLVVSSISDVGSNVSYVQTTTRFRPRR